MDQTRKNTLSSLSGFPVKDGMAGLATGDRNGKPAEREQETYTPQCVVDLLLRLWPEGIALDPCSGPDSIVPARERWYGALMETGRIGKRGPIMEWVGPGLTYPWRNRTYINNPFSDLQDWMPYSAAQQVEQVMLAPVRPNRKWWRAYAASSVAIGWLDPLPFLGHAQAHPAPLALHYRGGDYARFAAACQGCDWVHVGTMTLERCTYDDRDPSTW